MKLTDTQRLFLYEQFKNLLKNKPIIKNLTYRQIFGSTIQTLIYESLHFLCLHGEIESKEDKKEIAKDDEGNPVYHYFYVFNLDLKVPVVDMDLKLSFKIDKKMLDIK